MTTSIDLLWTGGWDSTFRLLQLLFDEGTEVQPWYLVDEERLSSPREIEAMEQIREALEDYRPESRGRLRATRVVNVATLAGAPDLSDMASRLRLGSQYEWLARFAREYDLDGLELSVESRPGRVQELLEPLIEETSGPGGPTFRVATGRIAAEEGNVDLALFSAFSFPLFRLTKQDMLREARSRGWEPLLALTWFCHSPKREQPCGVCDPCMIAIKSGMSDRIPITRRLRPLLRFIRDDVQQRLGSK